MVHQPNPERDIESSSPLQKYEPPQESSAQHFAKVDRSQFPMLFRAGFRRWALPNQTNHLAGLRFAGLRKSRISSPLWSTDQNQAPVSSPADAFKYLTSVLLQNDRYRGATTAYAAHRSAGMSKFDAAAEFARDIGARGYHHLGGDYYRDRVVAPILRRHNLTGIDP